MKPIPIYPPPPPYQEPRSLEDIIRGLFQNPLSITNSIESAKEIVDLFTDNDLGNDRIACNLLGELSKEQIQYIQNVLHC